MLPTAQSNMLPTSLHHSPPPTPRWGTTPTGRGVSSLLSHIIPLLTPSLCHSLTSYPHSLHLLSLLSHIGPLLTLSPLSPLSHHTLTHSISVSLSHIIPLLTPSPLSPLSHHTLTHSISVSLSFFPPCVPLPVSGPLHVSSCSSRAESFKARVHTEAEEAGNVRHDTRTESV